MFTPDLWMEKLLNFITIARLPFRIVEHPEFKDLVELAQLAPSRPDIPSTTTIRRHLHTMVKERQQKLLQRLPPGGKLSIALDCWTSPFCQAFMASTGYFIDQEWNYCEILLGFEPLYGTHTGSNLSSVLFNILQEHNVTDRVLSITTDNASNNNTMMSSIQASVQAQNLNSDTIIIRVPCIAHVIQLSLNQLLGKMKANPVNDTTETEWSDACTHSLHTRYQTKEIADTLNKV